MRVPRVVVLPLVVLGSAIAIALSAIGGQGGEHERFYRSGKSIAAFLSDYCDAFGRAHAEGRAEPVLALYAPDRPPRRRWRWEPKGLGAESGGEIEVRRLRRAGPHGGPEAELLAELRAFATLDGLACKIALVEELEPDRAARLSVKLLRDGTGHGGEVFRDQVFQRWWLVRGAGAWRIARDELIEGTRVSGRGESLLEVDPVEIGIDFRHRRDPKLDMRAERERLRFGVIQHASGGLAAADYDGDGRDDLLFLDGREVRLYRNQGVRDGLPRFADVTAAAGLAGIGEAHSGLFADFDNDGDRDLFVARYLARNLYFANDGSGRFAERGAEVGLNALLPSSSATLLDFDRDGDLDLYLGVYGNAFEALPRLPFYARNGGRNRLYRNDGGRFTDVTEHAGGDDPGWSLAVASADVDGDGWPDLATANDFGRKNLYRNRGDGTFREMAKEAGVLDFGFGMGLAFGDIDEDGDPDLYTANVNSNQRWFGEDVTIRQYVRNFARTRWLLADSLELWSLYRLLGSDWSSLFLQVGEGNSLFENQGDGSFEERRDGHTQRGGWGWGVAFLDLDNDTDLDLYAANGWISNTPETDL